MTALPEPDLIAHVRLARSRSVGPVAFRKLLERHGSARQALDALLDGPHARKVATAASAARELETAAGLGAHVWCAGETDYPARLAALDDAPPVLYGLGASDLTNGPTIAIVGARNASGAGLKLTASITGDLGEAGITIVSGMARGIDTAAHKASLATGSIACLAGGADVVYPRENAALYGGLRDQGLIVSEMPPGTQPQARHFPRRNRIISGLSDGVVIIEAAARSGSLITARYAAEQGRDLYAVPGSPLDPRSAGANRLLKDGAILVRDAADILAELPTPRAPADKVRPPATGPSTAAAPPSLPAGGLVALLSPSPLHIDDIVALSGDAAARVAAELQVLELEGKVVRHPGGRFSLN